MRTNSTILDPAAEHIDNEATALTRARYQRISPIYDKIEWLMEKRFRPWRQRLWQLVHGPKVLEIGVGTGKNMEFWPADLKITAIDLTPGMLDIARQRIKTLNRGADLRLGMCNTLSFLRRLLIRLQQHSFFVQSRILSKVCVRLAGSFAPMDKFCSWNIFALTGL